jgi:hypothetical protein
LILVDGSFVPKAVDGESQDRPFAAIVRGAKADLQIAGSFSLTQLAPVQRYRTLGWFVQFESRLVGGHD